MQFRVVICLLRLCRYYPCQVVTKSQFIFQFVECLNYEYLGDDTRARGYGNVQSFKCDNKLKTKWYRFRGSSGNELPSSCVPMNSCGTHAPGWLQGHHPTVAQGIAALKACFHWKKGCCQWQTDIRVRNCDGFYVYELKPSPACHLRYCGNSGERKIGINVSVYQ